MRIRSTKPEFWRSKLIASVSWDARLVLKALESYVDDNGVGEDDVNTLVGDCFLHDLIREPSRTLARVSEAISHLHQAGLLWRYEADGRNLLYVSFWETVQRIDKAQPGRNPRPDGTFGYKESVIREWVATPRDDSRSLAPGTGEQGNRGTGDQGTEEQISSPPAARVSDGFDAAYDRWPKKVERKQAFDRFKIALRKRELEELVADIIRFGDAYAATTEKQFIPALGVWLGRERWTDELPQPRGSEIKQSKASQNAEEYRRLFGGDERSIPALDPGVGA